jgi:uncharacterized membrane protein YgdD (TMEM256/DUF423 family)
MQKTRFLAAFTGMTAVALGAFGAHALKARLTGSGMETVWQTAVFYQLTHAIAALGVTFYVGGKVGNEDLWLKRAAASWLIGVGLFSGSLYGLALGGPRWLGPVTPLGGLAFIVGWLIVLVAACKSPRA